MQRTVIIDLVNETAPDLTADLDGDGLFDHWESTFGIADPAGDDDHDGLPNFLEFLGGSNPAQADLPALAGPVLQGSGPADLGLAWNVRNGFLLGSDYHLERATDNLSTWTPLTEGPGYEVISITPLSPGISRIVVRAPSTTSSAFLRLAKP